MVGQHKPCRGRLRIRGAVFLQSPHLSGVDVNARVETAHRGPVPAGAGRQHRVERGGGLVVLLQREQAKRAELVDRGVVWQGFEGLVSLLECLGEVPSLERGAGRVEGLNRRIGDRGLRRRRTGAEWLRIIDRRRGDRGLLDDSGWLGHHDGLLPDHRRHGVVGVDVGPVTPAINGRANPPGPDASDGQSRHERPAAAVPPVAAVLTVPVTVDPALVISIAGAVRPVGAAVDPARLAHIHITRVILDIIDGDVVAGIDRATGPVDSHVDVVVRPVDGGVAGVIADVRPVDGGVAGVIAHARPVDGGVAGVVADAGPVDGGVAGVVADARPVSRAEHVSATSASQWWSIPLAQPGIGPGDLTWTQIGPGDLSWPGVWPGHLAWTRIGPGDLSWGRACGSRRHLWPRPGTWSVERRGAIERGSGTRIRTRSRPCTTCPSARPLSQSGALGQRNEEGNSEKETDRRLHWGVLSGWAASVRGRAGLGWGGVRTSVISSASGSTSDPSVRSTEVHLIVSRLTRVRMLVAEAVRPSFRTPVDLITQRSPSRAANPSEKPPSEPNTQERMCFCLGSHPRRWVPVLEALPRILTWNDRRRYDWFSDQQHVVRTSASSLSSIQSPTSHSSALRWSWAVSSSVGSGSV